MRPRPRTSQETDAAGSPCGRRNVHWRPAPRQTGIGREKLHNFDGMNRVHRPSDAHEEASVDRVRACAWWRRRRRRLAVAQARRRRARCPRYETVAVDRGPIVAKVTATGTLSALVTVQVGTPGVGPHQGDQRRLQLAREEGAGDREDRAGAVRGRARVRRARTTWPAQGTVAKLEAQAENAKLQYERARGAVRAQGDRAGGPGHGAGDDARRERRRRPPRAGNLAQAKASLHQAQVNLDYTTIVSPTTGVVISRSVDVGQTVAASLSAPTLFRSPRT